MRFSVTVRTTDGERRTQTLEAPSRFAVYAMVEKDGGTVESFEESASASRLPAWLKMSFGSAMNAEARITFAKNLAAMLSAGLTLSRALSVIERQATSKGQRALVAELGASVKRGTSFHEALAAYPREFSELFVAMVKAGEESGTLAAALAAVARQMERTHTLAKKIKGAMIYPCVILAAIAIIGVLMLMYVVPTLAQTFAELHVPLPMATRIILGLSAFITGNLLAFLAVVLALVITVAAFARSRAGAAAFLWVALRLPVIGTLVRETYAARAARTLSSLLSAGVEMLGAIRIAKEVVGQRAFAAVLDEAEMRVKKGESLSAAFIDHAKLYPVFVGDMISVGEETGNVSVMLGQVAAYYEDDVEASTKDLSTVIEPLLMLVIGAFVGVFAIAMIAPIYSLSSQI